MLICFLHLLVFKILNWFFQQAVLQRLKFLFFKEMMGLNLVVQWLRLILPIQGAWVQSCMLCSTATRKKRYY